MSIETTDEKGRTALDHLPEVMAALLRELIQARCKCAGGLPAAEPWLTTSEGARYAAVSEDTLREWIANGQLQAGRVGRVLRVRRSDIDRLLLDRTSKEDDEPLSERAREIVASLAVPPKRR